MVLKIANCKRTEKRLCLSFLPSFYFHLLPSFTFPISSDSHPIPIPTLFQFSSFSHSHPIPIPILFQFPSYSNSHPIPILILFQCSSYSNSQPIPILNLFQFSTYSNSHHITIPIPNSIPSHPIPSLSLIHI